MTEFLVVILIMLLIERFRRSRKGGKNDVR